MNEIIISNSLKSHLRIIRLLDDGLVSSDCTLEIEFQFLDGHPLDTQQRVIGVQKRWIDEILNGCVAFDVSSSLDTDFFGQLGNQLMFCPDEPNDHLLLMLIVAKLNAIGQKAVKIASAKFVSDSSFGFCVNFSGDPCEILPSVEEWMGSVRFYGESWWNRSDGSMMDIPFADGDDINSKPDILINLDENIIPTVADSDSETTDKIIRLNFKKK